jgi:hypothetical protein
LLRAGEILIVESGLAGVTVSDGLLPIGHVPNPSADLLAAPSNLTKRSAQAFMEVQEEQRDLDARWSSIIFWSMPHTIAEAPCFL